MNISRSYPQLLPGVIKTLKQIGLRPIINIDENTTNYREKPGCFFAVHLYWSESYMDKLYFSPKWTTLIEKLSDFLRSLPNISRVELGASDGHLFFYLHITN